MRIILEPLPVHDSSFVATLAPGIPEPAALAALLEKGPVLIMPGQSWGHVLMQQQEYEKVDDPGYVRDIGTVANIVVTTDRS